MTTTANIDTVKTPRIHYSILTHSNPKLHKSVEYGFLTAGLHLAPYKSAGIPDFNMCPNASPGCIKACLNRSGRGAYDRTQAARKMRSWLFVTSNPVFMENLNNDLLRLRNAAHSNILRPACRLNTTSDIPWEDYIAIFKQNHDIQFYDYTKSLQRYLLFIGGRFPKNYHLVFSRSEINDEDVGHVLRVNGTITVVYKDNGHTAFEETKIKLRKRLIKMFGKDAILGKRIINGDIHDLTFLHRKGTIIALKAKGPATKDESGFVIHLED